MAISAALPLTVVDNLELKTCLTFCFVQVGSPQQNITPTISISMVFYSFQFAVFLFSSKLRNDIMLAQFLVLSDWPVGATSADGVGDGVGGG